MNEFLEDLCNYLSKIRKVDLYSDSETDKTKLYDNITKLFKEKEDELKLYLLTNFEGLNKVGNRVSMWKFENGGSLDLIEHKNLPIISLGIIGEDYLRDRTNLLIHQIKENLGIELGCRYQKWQ
jgi:hypothetical protein